MNVLGKWLGCAVGVIVIGVTASATAQDKQDNKISIAIGGNGFAAVVPRFAKEMGLFEKHGVNAELVTVDTGIAAVTALLSGSVGAALAGTSDAITAQGRGQKVIVLNSVYGGFHGTLVLTKAAIEKRGVSPNDPLEKRLAALDGLVIATPSPTSAYTITLKAAATKAGANIRFAYIAGPAMPSALQAGAVDGLIVAAPTWIPSVVQGSTVVWISGPKGEFPPETVAVSAASLQTMRGFADANRPLMERVVAAMEELGRAVDENPAGLKAAMAKVFPGSDAAAIDLMMSSDARSMKTKPLTPEDLKHDIGILKASGVELPQIDSVDLKTMLFR